MPDRRVADRRAPEKGVIKIPLKTAIIGTIVSIVLITSFAGNIVLAVRNSYYKEELAKYESLVSEYLKEK